MSVLFFGDTHANKDEIRLLTTINFLDYIIKYCKEHPEIKSVINLGDTFDTSENKAKVLIPVFQKFQELSKIVKIFTIVGNHDTNSKDNAFTLAETFGGFSTFIQSSQTIDVPGLGEADFMSYTQDVNAIPNKSKILFGHLEVQGFMYNPSRAIESSFFTEDNFSNYYQVVSGHLHHYQNKNNFCFIGSPYPTNRGEKNKKNYFGIIDDTYNITLEEYTEAPDYITVKIENALDENIDYTNKLVDVEISSKVEQFVKLRDILYNKGALIVNPIFIKEELVDEEQHTVDTTMNLVEGVIDFINEQKVEKIDNTKLLECYKNILERIKS